MAHRLFPLPTTFSRLFSTPAQPSPISTFLNTAIQQNPILIFIKGTPQQPQCGFSRTVVQILQKENVPFTAVNVLEDQEVREEIKKVR